MELEKAAMHAKALSGMSQEQAAWLDYVRAWWKGYQMEGFAEQRCFNLYTIVSNPPASLRPH